MIKVYTSSVIDAPADAVWARVRDFNGLPQWTPFVAGHGSRRPAADRIGCCGTSGWDGGVIRERLLTLSTLTTVQLLDPESPRASRTTWRRSS